jgi:signal transduction histidine kinase
MSPLWKLRMRMRAIDPRTADLILGGLFAAAAVIEAILSESVTGHVPYAAAVGALSVGPSIALRRKRPFAAAAIFIVVLLGSDLAGPSVGDEVATPFIAALFLYYSIGRYAEGRRFWAAAGLMAIGLMGLLIADSGGAGDFLYVMVLAAMPALAGRAVRSRVLLQRELRVKALRLEAGREDRARRAVEDERGRIAEELQTVVANGLSAMIVQAGAVPRVLAAGDTAAAQQSFLVIEETGRDALAEMRRLLGVLRHEEDEAELAPQPGLARIGALLERMRQEGLEVQLTTEGAAAALPTGIDLTAYRVVQQAVEAAYDAEAQSAALTIRYGPRSLEIDLSDDRPADTGPDVSSEMLERVRLYGGRVHVGGSNGDRHQVSAWLPLGELAAR